VNRARRALKQHYAVLVIVGSIAGLTACNLDFISVEPHVNITYENNTDSLLCLYHGTAESPRSFPPDSCSVKIEPMNKTTWSRECPSGVEVSAAEVVLLEESTRDVLYARTAICREWIDSGSKVTIDKHGDEFVVTDGFQQ